MNPDNTPKMQRAQTIYGSIVYWVTIVSCIICMIGPVMSVASPEKNVLNPCLHGGHYTRERNGCSGIAVEKEIKIIQGLGSFAFGTSAGGHKARPYIFCIRGGRLDACP